MIDILAMRKRYTRAYPTVRNDIQLLCDELETKKLTLVQVKVLQEITADIPENTVIWQRLEDMDLLPAEYYQF